MTTTVDTIRLNIGCGDYPLAGWVNIDSAADSKADEIVSVPPLPYATASVSDIYAGHFLEHLDQPVAAAFLMECYRVLVTGGRAGILVPDTREVMRRYINGDEARMQFPAGNFLDLRDLDNLCAGILFSTLQPSRHQWAWDLDTLRRAMGYAGFQITGEIDRHGDPRIPVGAWYQCGLDGRKA